MESSFNSLLISWVGVSGGSWPYPASSMIILLTLSIENYLLEGTTGLFSFTDLIKLLFNPFFSYFYSFSSLIKDAAYIFAHFS